MSVHVAWAVVAIAALVVGGVVGWVGERLWHTFLDAWDEELGG